MAYNKHWTHALAAVGLLLALAAPQAAAYATPPPHGDVEVVDLSVDERYDEPEGLDNPRPTLRWRMAETRRAKWHPCHLPGARIACPADNQTAYEVQAALLNAWPRNVASASILEVDRLCSVHDKER